MSFRENLLNALRQLEKLQDDIALTPDARAAIKLAVVEGKKFFHLDEK